MESNTPSDYTWSEIKGEQGVPGAPGADGKTYYTWIAYSDNADGTGMYQQPKDTTKYIGIAVNKETATESSNPSDYTWSLFKGKDGADGLSVIGGGHWESSKTPYEVNTMVTLAGCVFISKVKTSNPPIKIARFRNGNYRKKKDGGYILAGKSADWTVHEDWEMLLDGRELKGESITFLGEFASHPSIPRRVTATEIRLTIVLTYTGMVCGWSWSKTGLTVRTAKVTSGSTPVPTSSALPLTSRIRSSRMIIYRKAGQMIFLAWMQTIRWNGRANV